MNSLPAFLPLTADLQPQRACGRSTGARCLRECAWAAVGIRPDQAAQMARQHASLRANRAGASLQRASEVLDVPARRRLMQAIGAAYGRLYREAPDAFLWAGFAALAVNDGVLPTLELTLTAARLLQPVAGLTRSWDLDPAALAEDGIKAAVEANVAIFDDLFWVHLAYQEGGLLRLRALYRDGELAKDLLDGFHLIDRGWPAPHAVDGRRYIAAGNRLLFQREQRDALAPVFQKYQRALYAATALGLIEVPNRMLQAMCAQLGRSAAWPRGQGMESYAPLRSAGAGWKNAPGRPCSDCRPKSAPRWSGRSSAPWPRSRRTCWARCGAP